MKKLYLALTLLAITPQAQSSDDWTAYLTWQTALTTYLLMNVAALCHALVTNFKYHDPDRVATPTKADWLKSIEESKNTADDLEPQIYVLKNTNILTREKEVELFRYLENELAEIDKVYEQGRKNPNYENYDKLHKRVWRLKDFIDSEIKIINEIETIQDQYIAAGLITEEEIEYAINGKLVSNNPFLKQIMTLRRMMEQFSEPLNSRLNKAIREAKEHIKNTQQYYAIQEGAQRPRIAPHNTPARTLWEMHGPKNPPSSQKKATEAAAAPAESQSETLIPPATE